MADSMCNFAYPHKSGQSSAVSELYMAAVRVVGSGNGGYGTGVVPPVWACLCTFGSPWRWE
jgi:hypothetical protein